MSFSADSIVAPAPQFSLDSTTGKPVGANGPFFGAIKDQLADKGFLVTSTACGPEAAPARHLESAKGIDGILLEGAKHEYAIPNSKRPTRRRLRIFLGNLSNGRTASPLEPRTRSNEMELRRGQTRRRHVGQRDGVGGIEGDQRVGVGL